MHEHESQGVPDSVGQHLLLGGDAASLQTSLPLADCSWAVDSAVLGVLRWFPRCVGVLRLGVLALSEVTVAAVGGTGSRGRDDRL